jgi:hypothetical protein
MKQAVIGIVMLVAIAGSAVGQNTAIPKRFKLYVGDESCVCIATKKQTMSAAAAETRTNRSVFQEFWSRTEPKRKLFRVRVGTFIGSENQKWWNYGIADEGDFNGDGLPDYSWYGGDDTSFEMYLFLSAGSHYERVNVLKTIGAAWKRQFGGVAPDLGEAGGEYAVTDISIERTAKGLMLTAVVKRQTVDGKNKGSHHFEIAQADFNP